LDTAAVETQGTYGTLFANSEFRALWLAQILSVLGDQLARVALTLLVYERTRSPLLAAVTFAASVLPVFVGGLALAGLADRLPRRELMIACDLARLVLVLVMAIPGVPLPVLVGLLFAVTMISTPFTSARSAMYPDILPGDSFALGTAVTMTTYQVALVAGFAGGGAVVGFFGVRPSLLADAATFGVSALIAFFWVRHRPAARARGAAIPTDPAADPGAVARRGGGPTAGVRLVFSQPAMRTPMLLGCLATFYNAPEGVAAPLARSVGGGALATGLILTAGALGPSVGAVAFTRLVRPLTRAALMRPLAIACCATLVLFAGQPGLPLALLILFVSGLFDCFQVPAVTAFVQAAPAAYRSQVFGVAQAAMSLGQGTAMIAAGAIAEHVSPSTAIAISGAVGAVAAAVISAGPR
jgi:predicted MFS family arabinose efflux permease